MSEAESHATAEAMPHEAARRPPRGVGQYLHALVWVAALVAIVALALANRDTVTVDWVVGSSEQSLIWIVLVTAILGWLLGIFTSILFRHRRRARRP
jgi:uncharacterized integral membrane protein